MNTVTSDAPFLVIGNWKMNGSRTLLGDFARELSAQSPAGCKRILCLPSVLLTSGVVSLSDVDVELGAQDCSEAPSGARTGEVSAGMLVEAGARWVIVGHSERRAAFGETSTAVRDKAHAAAAAGLVPIICIGESKTDRDAGRHLDVILEQLELSMPPVANELLCVIAYEPVWAIGSGQSASADQVAEAHGVIANWLNKKDCRIPVLYGGSVKPDSAPELARLPHVDGFLVGGASLEPASFEDIAKQAAKARLPMS
ncbi:triose-phosphate isomerase [Ruegeria marina]|uniref:Triosephosphate isomerase n=1 Tax=Ruegeria marina TaxID=639004 RepID=A0A1G6ZJN2_9RHOB|nr:triose-phosphate isomerase [Ruegeria marina]SDE02964.1 triosephosphate isomerase [Ruegeria marina]